MILKGLRQAGTSSKNSVRKIFKTNIENMVRIISGTLVDVGLGKISPDDIPEIILSGDRKKAGKTLPPQGLYLLKVEY